MTSPIPSLPAFTTLPTLDDPSLKQILDLLFEPSPPLHTLVLPLLRSTPYPNYDALISAIRSKLLALASSSSKDGDVDLLSQILCAHPRLGEKKISSEQSRREQAQLHGGKDEEARMLEELNRQYEETFPGLRYVVFVNGRPRPEIMDNMRARIARGDIQAERLEAIEAMCDIAADRAKKLLRQQEAQ
ncbi:uncharacterized protein EI97DRAFT_436395 [Westerdykella ornata]|uniref:Oxo-4-hydroxy-4-carboxy-5-ureidoimidazoline decarboxylase domain-containing protein n=1 Tax=Westerdykella ornata TaxID=318751 RepID=A0A6A6JA89_WESOR|nr:uncharacterized protein EI97DRAFT_436395 [Westerdykella ornata]KAF2273154.1 hypothetical protein EI97DRAFT_436395 [Westerdykella ornata]